MLKILLRNVVAYFCGWAGRSPTIHATINGWRNLSLLISPTWLRKKVRCHEQEGFLLSASSLPPGFFACPLSLYPPNPSIAVVCLMWGRPIPLSDTFS